MIEEHRTLIGTLKALGYHERNIGRIYQFYAWTIALVGSVIGIVIGLSLYPNLIWNAYGNSYHMGAFVLKPDIISCVISVLGSVLVLSLTTTLACRVALRSNAAELMRPQSPQSGRRVLLERFTALWQRLTFSQKVTARNLFRYKKRFFMTVVGVAGSVMILLTVFGLRDSIASLTRLQFDGITHYQVVLLLKDGASKVETTSLNERLAPYESAYVYQPPITASVGDHKSDLLTYLFVPEDPELLDRFVTFKERIGQGAIEFPPSGDKVFDCVVTERLARQLKVGPGDMISFEVSGKPIREVRIAAVAENYLRNYIYLTPASYEALFGEAPSFTSVILDYDPAVLDEDDLQAEMLKDDNVALILPFSVVKTTMNEVVANLVFIVAVLIIVSALLALTILYNLVNLNIMERERELATLKVLGYYQREVAAYIFREVMILTLIGIVFGLIAGVLLHEVVMGAIEQSELMFPRLIEPQSYGYTVGFSLVCNVVITLAMLPRLKRIDPVGSLKSTE
jgi:putative ABC transport system permease protein